jgi:TolB-like protein/Flp pilus assembly protein TadD
MAQDSELLVDADAVRQELDRIVSSKIFAAAKRSQMFLRFVVERSLADAAPKEFEIALEVFDRGESYDPEIDATVRVEASRLRSRLREYYDTLGADDPILIDIPKGGYGAVFVSRRATTTSKAAMEDPLQSRPTMSDAADSQEASATFVRSDSVSASPPSGQAAPRIRLPSTKGSARWRIGSVIATTAIAGLLVLIVFWIARRKQQTAGPIRSLAVLPLQNLSGNTQEEYFVDGMTDALITELAHTPNLRVVSRTSVMREKGSQKSLRQIASELDVDAVVEGSVVRSGDRIRITAQLIDVLDDRHLWAQSYEEQMTDILTLQDKIVREITFQTQAALAPNRERIPSGRVNPAAYDAYLRGLYFLNQRDIDKSVGYLERAVSLDSSYAAAYAGLAEALTTRGLGGGTAHLEEQSRALAAARRAIELDPESGEAYAALGLVEINYGKDWDAAGRDLEKGIALSPSNAMAEMQYSIYLDAMARPEDAVSHMRRALQLDPRSFLMNRHLGVALYFARHYDDALLYLRRALEIEPTRFRYAEPWISRSYEMAHRMDDAERIDLQDLSLSISDEKLAPLRRAYQSGGWKAYQRARIGLISGLPDNGCGLYEIGESYMRLGDRARAFSSLARGIKAGCFWADSLPVDPLLDDIRDDPRFPALLKMAHLGNTSKAKPM